MLQFPKGFFFQHIILDKCQTVRDPYTGCPRLVRIVIRAAYQDRPDIDTNPASLVLVFAIPAINKHSDYRGLASLF